MSTWIRVCIGPWELRQVSRPDSSVRSLEGLERASAPVLGAGPASPGAAQERCSLQPVPAGGRLRRGLCWFCLGSRGTGSCFLLGQRPSPAARQPYPSPSTLGTGCSTRAPGLQVQTGWATCPACFYWSLMSPRGGLTRAVRCSCSGCALHCFRVEAPPAGYLLHLHKGALGLVGPVFPAWAAPEPEGRCPGTPGRGVSEVRRLCGHVDTRVQACPWCAGACDFCPLGSLLDPPSVPSEQQDFWRPQSLGRPAARPTA